MRKYYQNIFDQYKAFLESCYKEVKVSGHLGYGVGIAKVKLVPGAGGDTLVSTAKYINILQRQSDGSWSTTMIYGMRMSREEAGNKSSHCCAAATRFTSV